MTLLPGLVECFSETEVRKRAAWDNALSHSKRPIGDCIKTDCDGRPIRWSEYGQYSEYGWHIDHIVPSAIGGSDERCNLRARHWRGNSEAGGMLAHFLSEVRERWLADLKARNA